MSPAVLGSQIINVLEEMIDAIGKCNVGMVQPTGFTSTIDGITLPGGGSIATGWSELKRIKNNLKRINSKHVFIGLNENWK